MEVPPFSTGRILSYRILAFEGLFVPLLEVAGDEYFPS